MRTVVLFSLVITLLFSGCALANSGGGEKKGEEAGPQYVPMEPTLIVNLQGKNRYLRADIQLLIEGPENVERIKTHLPALRHSLIMLLSNRTTESLATVEEREKLRLSVLEEIKKTLDKYAKSEGLMDVYFTEFLVQ